MPTSRTRSSTRSSWSTTCPRDETVEIARQLGLDVIIHAQNRGYGGNQKTCYDAALAARRRHRRHASSRLPVRRDADPGPDRADRPRRARPDARQPVPRRSAGGRHADAGSTSSNRFLTTIENIAFELHLSEYHTGLRAYSRRLLETIPYQANSDDFVFDQELIAQVVAAGMRRRIGEIAVPTRYFEEASSVGFRRSVVYGISTLRVVARYLLHRLAHPPIARS